MSGLYVFQQTEWFIAGPMAGLPASAALTKTSLVIDVAVTVATAAPPGATAALQAIQSCHQETAVLERSDYYSHTPASEQAGSGDAALVRARYQDKAWACTIEQERRRQGNTMELLITQVPGKRPTTVITTPAIGHVPPRPVLMFNCVDDITRIQVALMHPLDVHGTTIILNTDSRTLRSHRFVRRDGTLLEFNWGLPGIDEVKQLFNAKTLTVDIDTDNAAGELTFNVGGLTRVIASLRDACRWAGEQGYDNRPAQSQCMTCTPAGKSVRG